uniref:Uncharacterized protein n=1 Tax=viral metagenome TaxID=1070528 RepID=A0A6C0HA01_9ZZZZ
MALIDILLRQQYKSLLGLSGLQTDVSGNSTFLGSVTVNSSLFVSNSTILNTLTGNSNINIYNNILSNSNFSIFNSLNLSGKTTINNNLTINSILNISNNAIYGDLKCSGSSNIQGSISINNSLNVSGITNINSSVVSNLFQSINNSLSINGYIIIIGNQKSKIYINGTSTYIGITNIQMYDKIITLNINSPIMSGADTGINSGIQLLGTSGFGYIKTSSDASIYSIKAPRTNAGYIAIQNINNNLNISGSSILNNIVTINSSLLVSNNSIIKSNLQTNSLNFSGNCLLYSNITLNNSLNISGNTIIKGDISIMNTLNIFGNTIILNAITVGSHLFISNNNIINNKITILPFLNISNNSIINGNTTILSQLNVSGNNILINNTVYVSSLSILGTTILKQSVSVRTQLSSSGATVINNNTSINSSLNISGSTIINSNITLLSNINIKGLLTAPLKNYNLNSTAQQNGIPIGGLYNNSGVVTICYYNVSPTININGSSTVTLNYGSVYTDLGITVTSIVFNKLYGYIYSIGSGTTNIITNNILVSGTTTITNTTGLTSGSYLVSYIATDPGGLIGYNSRNLIVPTLPSKGLPINIKNISTFANTFNPNLPSGYTFNYINTVGISYDGSIVAVCSRLAISTVIYASVSVYQIQNNIWTQLGNPINMSLFGTDASIGMCSLSYDGLTVVISTPGYKGTGPGSNCQGKLEVYSYNGSNWIIKGQTIYGNTSIGSRMGYYISISQDTNIVTTGYHADNPTGVPCALQVFKYNANQWTQLGNNINYLSFDDPKQWSASNTGLINSFSALNANTNIQNYTLVSQYNPVSLQWERLGSLITQYNYPSLQYPRFGRLSGDGYTIIICSISSNWFGTLFYNNIDWIFISSSTLASIDTYNWQTNCSSYNNMILVSKTASIPVKGQLFAYYNSTWNLIAAAFDSYTTYNNNLNTLAISGNGNYIICVGTGTSQALSNIIIRTYKINY